MQIAISPILDWWIIPHIALFLWLASSIHAKWEPRWYTHVLFWLLCSYSWEIAEYFLQRHYTETWIVIESPVNAWLIDPLSNGVGWFIGALIGRWSKNRKLKCQNNI